MKVYVHMIDLLDEHDKRHEVFIRTKVDGRGMAQVEEQARAVVSGKSGAKSLSLVEHRVAREYQE